MARISWWKIAMELNVKDAFEKEIKNQESLLEVAKVNGMPEWAGIIENNLAFLRKQLEGTHGNTR